MPAGLKEPIVVRHEGTSLFRLLGEPLGRFSSLPLRDPSLQLPQARGGVATHALPRNP